MARYNVDGSLDTTFGTGGTVVTDLGGTDRANAVLVAGTQIVLVDVENSPVVADDERIVFALDDTPSKRYGPKVEGAGLHHNPTPGPAQQEFVYGHSWVTLARLASHPEHGTTCLLGQSMIRKVRWPPKRFSQCLVGRRRSCICTWVVR